MFAAALFYTLAQLSAQLKAKTISLKWSPLDQPPVCVWRNSKKSLLRKPAVKLIVGKGGMGKGTEEGCAEHKALHCVFPVGCAVVAAVCVEEIEDAQWRDLGMPETLWVCRVKEFGPLIVSIDTHGNNLFEQNKIIFNQRKEIVANEICQNVSFIK